MTIISHNLTGKIDKKTVTLLSEIDTIALDLKLAFFIVGATARDILLQHAHGIYTTRATLDVDIGVFFSDWEQFRTLKEALVHTGKFSPTRQTQRLLFDDELLLDIVPFGGIAEENDSISWPPEYDIDMSVAGFQECYQHAVSVMVRAEPDLLVKVVSLAGLAILKLVSWDDNIERRGKDAADLFLIIKNYIAAGNMDRFFEEADILKAEDSDYDRSSARFLGREMARMAGQATKTKLVGILEREAVSSQGHQIAMDVLRRDKFQNESYEQIVAYFNALLRGLLD
ncbi:MAG: nucleotidyl transferase AbiEii/AbiGii toxin family protein [Desulfobacterales bacterium]